MCYHLFSCLAPRTIQDVPMTSNLPPRPPPDVPRRFKRCLSYPPKLPRTSPGAPKSVQATPRPLPDVHERFPRDPSWSRTLKTNAYSLHLLPTCGPRLEGQGQKSQVRGPEFMAGSAGPRRVCSLFIYLYIYNRAPRHASERSYRHI